ncbi:PAS domain S-box-containing protein/TyrR family helix-turn-helix domain-containing protein [Dethiosulfatibacter aminovorans DSM 17477]|uniref:HTH-type transcriptional regulatory protein TyrR n=1 Tax=Dethiosulfatibacter aminovorans DSM 17477 TaxID=1121476 RepID=A0A1M6MPD3_9FIRM|nr:sigma 54-interacting transcriptional regulator [Dethiosulfatibacter aminovorans]SHJ85153.1 PAS domain S-box-containing protein/TyrR family helix-turn-helix domain-containing protein [Dethiosulfatibacter aminovorans DSM 17477]
MEKDNLLENREHECIYKKILDNSYDEIFVVDGEDKVIYVNDACEKHYGLKPEDMIGKNVKELVELGYWYPKLDVQPYVYKTKKSFTVEQTTILNKKLVTTVVPVLDDDGNIEMVVQNVRDKTGLEDFRNELEKIRSLLEEKSESENNEAFFDECDFGLITYNNKIKEIMKITSRAASVGSTILILGESGTGKGLIAKTIHNSSERKDKPFIAINCAAIPENLLESELFGYETGAFTGAEKNGRVGLIELAKDGTLFLDEIGEITPRIQAKLLHVLQNREYYSIGGREVKTTNATIIAATNRNLEEMVEAGEFRQDLYYRLNIMEVRIPPLRNRTEEIAPLSYFFLDKFDKKYDTHHELSKDLIELFKGYSWLGNVRELENLIERMVITAENDTIGLNNLPEVFVERMNRENIDGKMNYLSLDALKDRYEAKLIKEYYEECGTTRKLAEKLNISQTRAARLVKKYLNS